MASYFCFISNTTDTNPKKLSTDGFCNGLSKTCLTHSRWSSKAQNRSLVIRVQFSDGEKLKDPFLHLIEAEMPFIEGCSDLG